MKANGGRRFYRFTPEEGAPVSINRRLGGPRARLDVLEKRSNLPLSNIEQLFLGPSARSES
jgi:hypothetical protein